MTPKRSFSVVSVALTAVLSLTTFTANAHTPYIAPTSFEPVMGGYVTLDASFAEAFFIPEAAFSGSEYTVTETTGEQVSPDTVTELKTRVVVEHKLEDEGTYRISTGSREGGVFLFYEVDGESKRAMNPTEPLPEGAEVKMHFQSITRADTYVTHKKPSNTAVKVEETGLQILPLTHPNSIFAGEEAQVKLIFDGEAHQNTLEAYPANGEHEAESTKFESNDNGVVNFTLPAGKYLLKVRHRAPAPEGANVPTYSHTTTLSILVFADN
ncbi:DUF4198 domain-containing protein [Thalassolituus maritimus]